MKIQYAFFVFISLVSTVAAAQEIPNGGTANKKDRSPAPQSAKPTVLEGPVNSSFDDELRYLEAWESRDISLASQLVNQLRGRATSRNEDGWRNAWINLWQREIDKISKLSPASRIRFFNDIEQIKLIYSSAVRSARDDNRESRLKDRITSLLDVIDQKCPSYLLAMEGLAYCQSMGLDHTAATATYKDICEARMSLIGQENPLYASDLENFGLSAVEVGFLSESRIALQKCEDIRKALYGPDSPQSIQISVNLSILDNRQGHFKQAAMRLETAISVQDRIKHESAIVTAACWRELGIAYGNLRENRKAETAFTESLRVYRTILPPYHQQVINTMKAQAAFFSMAGQKARFEEVTKEIEAIQARLTTRDKET